MMKMVMEKRGTIQGSCERRGRRYEEGGTWSVAARHSSSTGGLVKGLFGLIWQQH